MIASWAYLLVCDEGITYLGATSNLKRRLHAHNSQNNSGWTKGRRWYLLAAKRFETREEAFAYEALLKSDVRRRNAWKRSSIPRAQIIFARHGIKFDPQSWAPKKSHRVQPDPRPDYWRRK
ncbi:GIY-YIG nuclease family protein [Burkholderia vietnamiensis]|uniref:GIY-YIG nuclease family protein n=1 Tax=Burkholderia vietnamiensis TaxID=60552 RepID=UPI001B9A869E|nr:GIY-YIG nuclease family protein [Burkholderia vietnamiensis]